MLNFTENLSANFSAFACIAINNQLQAVADYAIQNYGFSQELSEVVIEQFGATDFIESVDKVIERTMRDGFYGWRMFSETVPFYENNIEKIKAFLIASNDEFGNFATIPEYVASFRSFSTGYIDIVDIERFLVSGSDGSEKYNVFANNVSWLVAEDFCAAAVRIMENSQASLEEKS